MANEFVARKGLISSGSINVSGSVTASFFKGDGSQLTNLPIAAVLSSSVNIDTYTFVGNGSTTDYILSQSYNVSSLFVSVDGLSNTSIQDYTLSGTTLSFVNAPPTSSNILVKALLNVTQNMTGSFSGSFFGILSSASYATTASHALTASYVASAASDWSSLANKPADIVSSSTQVQAFLPGGTVSSSVQIDYNSITNKLSGVVSSSTQIIPLLPTGTVSASAQIALSGITGTTFATSNFTFPQNLTVAGTITAGALTSTGLVTFASLKGTGAITVTNILDEDNMASDSATALATQQSIKAYVDSKVATVDTLAEVLANGNTTGANDIIVNAGQKIRTPVIASQNNATAITIADTTGALTLASALTDSNLATISTAGKVSNSATTATSANTASAIVARDASGNFTAGTITAALTGNASTATTLQTARTINGVSFNGSADITVTAAAGTLSGNTLASGVTASSLTSVGTLSSLTVSGDLTVDTSTLKVDSANNRVGIGTATPDVTLDVEAAVGTSTSLAMLKNTSAVNANNIAQMQFWVGNSFGGLEQIASIHGINPNAGANNGGTLVFSTSANGTATTPTERMRIDANGNLGVGATSLGNYRLSLEGNSASVGVGLRIKDTNTNGREFTLRSDNGPLILADATAVTERARITAGGYFKASNDGTYEGATATYHELRQSTTTWAAVASNTNASPYGIYVRHTTDANNTGSEFLYCAGAAAVRATIRSNGGLANYQANNVDLSDARTKTDITPVASMWDKIAALEIVSYKYIDQTHDDVNIGVIAQQVETVDPVWVDNDGFGSPSKPDASEAVATDADADAEADADAKASDAEASDGEGNITAERVTAAPAPEAVTYDPPLKTVYNKDIYFAAIKALQEAMARIETLEARLAALEAK